MQPYRMSAVCTQGGSTVSCDLEHATGWIWWAAASAGILLVLAPFGLVCAHFARARQLARRKLREAAKAAAAAAAKLEEKRKEEAAARRIREEDEEQDLSATSKLLSTWARSPERRRWEELPLPARERRDADRRKQRSPHSMVDDEDVEIGLPALPVYPAPKPPPPTPVCLMPGWPSWLADTMPSARLQRAKIHDVSSKGAEVKLSEERDEWWALERRLREEAAEISAAGAAPPPAEKRHHHSRHHRKKGSKSRPPPPPRLYARGATPGADAEPAADTHSGNRESPKRRRPRSRQQHHEQRPPQQAELDEAEELANYARAHEAEEVDPVALSQAQNNSRVAVWIDSLEA